MTAATFDLTGEYAIEQNAQYLLTFSYPGNVTTAQIRSQIRKGYAPAELLAEFRVYSQPIYDADTNKTTFTIGLDSRATDRIPVPEDGQFWLYDLRIRVSGADNVRLLKGQVEVLPNVTEN